MSSSTIGGKYALLRGLARGGMAEVFLARQTGVEGFQKLVVIKRILPDLAKDMEFVGMFLDEARTAADLRHPNIVDIYEIGEDGGTWFMAMEFLHGRSVHDILSACARRKTRIPLGFAIQIVADAARGLDHAHRKTDLAGSALEIVHRDVTPSNVMVTADGVTKVVDFGVAKAASRSNRTETGMVKGKPSYMSPEQAMGKTLDARSDLFSLGAVLYEVLTGKRVFQRDSDLESMRAVAKAKAEPPSALNPEVPAELDAIVARALARRPQDRFADTGALAAALEDFLVERRLLASPARLAAWMRETFPELAAPPSVVQDPRLQVESAGGAAAAPRKDELQTSVVPRSGPRPGSDLPTETSGAALEVRAARRTNLADDPALFVGRANDLRAMGDAFAGGARLLTLLGPAGIGKTRLAARFGAGRTEELAPEGGGVWLCELADAAGVEGICSAAGVVLGVPATGQTAEESVAQLGDAIASRGKVMLVLDGFDRLGAHAPATVLRWMALAPAARFLVTSQERLRIPGEHIHELQALEVPRSAPDASSDPAALRELESVKLFLARARATRRDFEPSDEEVAAIAEIARQLDGIPLALELAAARIAVLPPAKILERLPRRFDLLAGTRRDGTSRQATLRGAIDWSWNLLQPWEQDALAQASVFRGGFSLEAAEEVLDLSAHDGAPWPLDVVQSLRDKSLLRGWETPELGGELRFGMYSNIRFYAAEKLAGGKTGAEGVLARHAAYYLRAGEEWAAGVDQRGGVEKLHRLATEFENLAAVFQDAAYRTPSTPESATLAARAMRVLDPVLSTRGPFAVHLEWLDAAVTAAETAPDPLLLAKLLELSGRARRLRGKPVPARADLEKALAIARAGGAVAMEATVLAQLSLLAVARGALDDAQSGLDDALQLARTAGDPRAEAAILGHLAGVAGEMGDEARARQLSDAALVLHRKLGSRRLEGVVLGNLGVFLRRGGKLDEARRCFEAALGIFREVRDRRSEGNTLGSLGGVLLELQSWDEARTRYEQALAIQREVGNRRSQAIFLGNLSILVHLQGRTKEARAWYGRAIDIARDAGDRRHEGLYLGYRAAAEASLGECETARATFDAANAALTAAGDELYLRAAGVLEGVLDLAQANDAASRDERDRAESLRRQAKARRDAALAAPPGGRGSPASRSEDVRFALAILARADTAGARA